MEKIIPLQFPQAPLQLQRSNNQIKVRCALRKKLLVLTPEEWVRQHVIHFLISVKNCPTGLMTIEQGLTYNRMNRRCDILVHNQTGKPWLLVECKAPEVGLTDAALQQIAQYNHTLQAGLLMVTNGVRTHILERQENLAEWKLIDDLPDWALSAT